MDRNERIKLLCSPVEQSLSLTTYAPKPCVEISGILRKSVQPPETPSCDHTYGLYTWCDESGLIEGTEQRDSHIHAFGSDVECTCVEWFDFCPKCGEKL